MVTTPSAPDAATAPPTPPETVSSTSKLAPGLPDKAARRADLIADALSFLADPKLVAGLVRAVRGSTTTRRVSGAGYATGTAKTDLAFLKDPKLSIEEKLLKLLGYMNVKWEKEMQAKLDQIAAGESTGAAKPSASKKKGGIFGGIKGALSKALGPAGEALFKAIDAGGLLKKLGGPVLAAAASALGLPAVAPLLLRYGPAALDAATNVLSAVDGASAKTSSPGTSGAKQMSDAERQTVLMEIQRIQSKQQEMLQLVSNILKANHDTRSSVINNIR